MQHWSTLSMISQKSRFLPFFWKKVFEIGCKEIKRAMENQKSQPKIEKKTFLLLLRSTFFGRTEIANLIPLTSLEKLPMGNLNKMITTIKIFPQSLIQLSPRQVISGFWIFWRAYQSDRASSKSELFVLSTLKCHNQHHNKTNHNILLSGKILVSCQYFP